MKTKFKHIWLFILLLILGNSIAQENKKNILIFILLLFSFSSAAVSKETTFTNEIFAKSQLDGKTVIIHSWNKTCSTCAKQVKYFLIPTSLPSLIVIGHK